MGRVVLQSLIVVSPIELQRLDYGLWTLGNLNLAALAKLNTSARRGRQVMIQLPAIFLVYDAFLQMHHAFCGADDLPDRLFCLQQRPGQYL